MIRQTLFLIALLTLMLPYTASAMIDLNKYSEKIYKPTAIVAEHTIIETDIDQKIAIMRMSGVELDRQTALDHIINQQAILYFYKDRKLSEAAIDFTINKLAEENGMSNLEFNMLLKKFAIDIKHLRRHVAAHMILNVLVNERIKNMPQSQHILYAKAKSTIDEINRTDKMLSQPIIEYHFRNQSQVKVAEIIVKQGKNLQKIIELLREGQDFSQIKNKFPTEVELSTENGIVGWLNFNDISALYQQVIKSIKINQIGEPLIANNNLLFIKLIDIRNVEQSKKFLNPKYMKLTFEEKAEQLYNNRIAALVSLSILNEIKQQLYIEIL